MQIRPIFLVILACFLIASLNVVGQESPAPIQHELLTEIETNPVEYRQLIKQAMESHLYAFGLILTMRAPDTEDMPLHAESLAWLAARQATLYPEGSETEQTGAIIWSQPELFERAVTESAQLAENLEEAVESGNRHLILNALTRFAEDCEQCHARFRVGEQ